MPALEVVYQCVEVAERCTQFQAYLTVIIHDDSFNHLAQQFFLIAALQAIIQRSNPGDNFQRQVQVVDMNLVILLHGFERSLNGLSAILPFHPHALPNLVRNLARRIQPNRSRFFIVNLLQRELQLAAPIRTRVSHALLKVFGVASTDEGNEIGIDLNATDFAFDRCIDHDTQETRFACAFNPVVGCTSTMSPGVRGRAAHSAQLTIVPAKENQSGEQIKLLAPHGSMGVSPRQDFLRPFKFLCRDDGFPIATHSLGHYPVLQADDPACIGPVVEDIAQGADIRLALSARCQFNEGSACAVTIAAFMERFRNFSYRHSVFQQQIPRFADDFGAFRVSLDPLVPVSQIGALLTVGARRDVRISIGRVADIATALALCLLSAACTDAQQCRLAPSKCERKRDQHPVVRVHRIEIGRVGKAHRYPEIVQFIDCTQGLRVIASEPVGSLDDHVRELACARIREKLLISDPFWCFARQHVHILVDDGQIGVCQHVPFDDGALTRP